MLEIVRRGVDGISLSQAMAVVAAVKHAQESEEFERRYGTATAKALDALTKEN